MKKMIALLIGLLLIFSVSLAEKNPASIQSMTDLSDIQAKLDQGVTIVKAYYTDGYGFSASEFTTEDPDEIAQLWTAVNAIIVGDRVNESITDWYPQIVFYLSDGTEGGVRFEANWLCIGGKENYEISNAEDFWSLTAALREKHESMENSDVPRLLGGWQSCPAQSGLLPSDAQAAFDKATGTLVGASYTPVALLSTQVVAGMNYCILCQITPVVPDAVPVWALVYIYADPAGNASISNIWEIYIDKHAVPQ